MNIYVIEDDIIQNIQKEFQRQYPYLRLRFYKNPHEVGEGSPACDRLKAQLPIEEVTMFHTGGHINTNPDRTVAEVERDFFRRLGLCVQVLRQSGNVWLETTDTDHWTLQQQNNKAKEYTQSLPEEQQEDFNLQDID